jgi:hypothetical protein
VPTANARQEGTRTESRACGIERVLQLVEVRVVVARAEQQRRGAVGSRKREQRAHAQWVVERHLFRMQMGVWWRVGRRRWKREE